MNQNRIEELLKIFCLFMFCIYKSCSFHLIPKVHSAVTLPIAIRNMYFSNRFIIGVLRRCEGVLPPAPGPCHSCPSQETLEVAAHQTPAAHPNLDGNAAVFCPKNPFIICFPIEIMKGFPSNCWIATASDLRLCNSPNHVESEPLTLGSLTFTL